MGSLKLDSLNVGDVIRTVRTHKVAKIGPDYVRIEDVDNGYEFYLGRDVNHGSLKVEMVKKAPGPTVRLLEPGDTVKAEDVAQFPWPVGTVLTGDDYVYLFGAKGWHSPSETGTEDYVFPTHELGMHAAEFKVVHLP